MSDIIDTCFGNLIFTKVEIKNGFAIYGACVSSSLAGGLKRYILVFVPQHLATKQQAKINELVWKNIQTRQLSYSYKLRNQAWDIPKSFQDIMLSVTERTNHHSMYSSSYIPFDVMLLHDPKKKTQLQYNNKLYFSAALNTFNCVINYVESPITNAMPNPSNWFKIDDPSGLATPESYILL